MDLEGLQGLRLDGFTLARTELSWQAGPGTAVAALLLPAFINGTTEEESIVATREELRSELMHMRLFGRTSWSG